MNKFIIITLLMFISNQSLSQGKLAPLSIDDSLLSTYLSNSLDTVSGVDSCFYGIYYIKFSLLNNEKINDFECSESMPLYFKTAIEKSLGYLKGKWNPLFLNFAVKKNKIIIQPILIYIHSDCAVRDNFYTKKLNLDSANYDCDIAHSLVIILGDMLSNIQSTFKKASGFKDESTYLDCILMPTCFVTGKTKTRL